MHLPHAGRAYTPPTVCLCTGGATHPPRPCGWVCMELVWPPPLDLCGCYCPLLLGHCAGGEIRHGHTWDCEEAQDTRRVQVCAWVCDITPSTYNVTLHPHPHPPHTLTPSTPSHPPHTLTHSQAMRRGVRQFFNFVAFVVIASAVWYITPHFICDILFYLILWHTVYIIVYTTIRKIFGIRRRQLQAGVQIRIN